MDMMVKACVVTACLDTQKSTHDVYIYKTITIAMHT